MLWKEVVVIVDDDDEIYFNTVSVHQQCSSLEPVVYLNLITSLKISHKINFLQNYVKTTETILQFISLNTAEIIRVLKQLRVDCVLAFNGKLFQRTETPYWKLRLPRSHLHFQQLQQFAGG